MKGYKSVGAFSYGKAAPNKSRRNRKMNFSSQERREQKSELIKKYRQGQTLPQK
jgi:hypothetical protein